jgi:hypothetical protein
MMSQLVTHAAYLMCDCGIAAVVSVPRTFLKVIYFLQAPRRNTIRQTCTESFKLHSQGNGALVAYSPMTFVAPCWVLHARL